MRGRSPLDQFKGLSPITRLSTDLYRYRRRRHDAIFKVGLSLLYQFGTCLVDAPLLLWSDARTCHRLGDEFFEDVLRNLPSIRGARFLEVLREQSLGTFKA